MTTSYTDPDVGKTPQQLFAERTKRMQEAMQLKQPDRIPIQLGFGYLLAEMGGITRQEQHENGEKEQELLEKAALYFQPDSVMGLFNYLSVSLAVGDRMTRFPGHGLDPNGSFQFVEGEYMKPEDYDAFLEDPADWTIRKYWPRVFSELEGLALLPPLGIGGFGPYALRNLGILTAPPVAKALQALGRAAEAQAAADACAMNSAQRLAALGFASPTFKGSIVEAPFDFMSDTLRGMRGIMLDIHRRPDKLLAAQEKVLRFQLEHAIAFSRATGLKTCFIPLHRGSDGFMSLAQFEKFYWPQLKAMQTALVENGIMPFVFYEGVWDQRLKYLAELPVGRTTGLFQFSDIFKVKEVLGGTMCIAGGMRNSMLQAGTADEVREFTIKLCREVGKGGGFIMTTGIGEMEGCNTDLVKVWVDTTKEYGVY
ncbi:MAG TPA: uroporphyrinogen decarboxylase family protein [Syntrophales bacterium]|nr:uroporphyrinogen decarboxylase family protein [Syntrophales bacterium]